MSAWPGLSSALAVMAGGACGACSRHVLNAAIVQAVGQNFFWGETPFPVGILCINVLGAFILGMLLGFCERTARPAGFFAAFAGTGFCGGFTTVSTFSLDTLNLYLGSGLPAALVNVFASVLLSVGATGFGYSLNTRSIKCSKKPL